MIAAAAVGRTRTPPSSGWTTTVGGRGYAGTAVQCTTQGTRGTFLGCTLLHTSFLGRHTAADVFSWDAQRSTLFSSGPPLHNFFFGMHRIRTLKLLGYILGACLGRGGYRLRAGGCLERSAVEPEPIAVLVGLAGGVVVGVAHEELTLQQASEVGAWKGSGQGVGLRSGPQGTRDGPSGTRGWLPGY